MAEKQEIDIVRRSTDALEGDLDTVEDSLRIHEGKRARAKTPAAEPNRKNTDLAEGERDTVEESIRAHERKGDCKKASG